MKKILFIVALMLMGAQSMNAQKDFTIDGIVYNTDGVGDGEVVIDGTENVKNNLVISPYVSHGGKTYKVFAIQNFENNEKIVSITIPNFFRVRIKAFAYAKKLEKVVLGDTVELRKYCFAECPQLKEVIFEGQLYGIFEGAFEWKENNQQRGFYFVSSTPPKVVMRRQFDFDESVYKQVTLYVPANSIESYKNDGFWGKFKIDVWNPDEYTKDKLTTFTNPRQASVNAPTPQNYTAVNAAPQNHTAVNAAPQMTNSNYAGGEAAMRRFIASTMRYPVKAAENGIQGTVTVVFTVEEDGSLTNIRLKRPVARYLNEEALRIVSKMPKWQPAQKGGVNVRSEQTVDINFRLR